MRITTRDLLAESMVEALDDRIAAAALRCLAAYCRGVKKTPSSLTVARFVSPAPEAEREAVLAKLQSNHLLAWDLRGRSGRVTLSPAFASEWWEIVDRLTRFGAALTEWTLVETETALARALRKGALLFNHRLFFEVHEVLEAQWARESDEEKYFLQGLIQIAVAFYHLENRNFRGALSLLQDGVEKITPRQPTFLGVELQEFIQKLEACQAELSRLGEQGVSRFGLDLIPLMRILT